MLRRLLDRLYELSAWLAGFAMITILIMVVLTMGARQFGLAIHGTDAYAGYATAGAGFLALASTLKHGEHIRVTLLLGMLRGAAHKGLELLVLGIGTVLAALLAIYSVRLVLQSYEINDISMGLDATPLWIPQLMMALGTVVFFIAFCDEFVLELLGKRQVPGPTDAHHE